VKLVGNIVFFWTKFVQGASRKNLREFSWDLLGGTFGEFLIDLMKLLVGFVS